MCILKHLSFYAVFLAAAALPLQADYKLAENGKALCSIVFGTPPSEPEKYAAEELAAYLKKISGADVATGSAPIKGTYPIFLGTEFTSKVPEAEGLKGDSYLIRADKNGMFIVGATPRAVLFGVYGFLEDHLGMRWFYPGEEGEFCPKNTTISGKDFIDRQVPSFLRRDMGLMTTAVNAPLLETRKWMVRNRLSRTTGRVDPLAKQHAAVPRGGGHSMHEFVPVSLYDKHPEYFPLIDGKRLKRSDAFAPNPCTSNPEVVRRAVEYVSDFFRKNPDGIFHIGNNDCAKWCECKDCLALDPPSERKNEYVSTRFTIFRNEVVKGVRRNFPSAEISSWAYQNYQYPSAEVKPLFNVVLCDHGRCYRHALSDEKCKANQWFREMFSKWAESGCKRSIFTYYDCFVGQLDQRTTGNPQVRFEYIVADDMRYQHKLGHSEWVFNTTPPDGQFDYLKSYFKQDAPWMAKISSNHWRAQMFVHYVQAKLAWNIHADVDKIVKEFNEKYYGPAAPAMEKFAALSNKYWTEEPGCFMYNGLFSQLGRVVADPTRIKALSDTLDEAEKNAKGKPPYEARIAKEKELFEQGWKLARKQFIQRPGNDARAFKRTGKITIDGKLDEADWNQSETYTDFLKPDGKATGNPAEVKLLYDGNDLYIGMKLFGENISTRKSSATERDSNKIWDDEPAEIFIDPEGKGLTYYHFAINSNGCLRDSKCMAGASTTGDVGFNPKVEMKTSRGDHFWTLEMRIPANELNGKLEKRWLMNAAYRGATWMDGTYHQTTSFRGVTFMEDIVRNGSFEETVPLDDKTRKKYPKSVKINGEKMASQWMPHYQSSGSVELIDKDAFAGKYAMAAENVILMNELNAKFRKGNRIKFGVAAKGEGTLTFQLYVYSTPFKAPILGTIKLTPEWKKYEFTYTIESDCNTIRLAPGIAGRGVMDAFEAVPVQ